MKTLRFTIILLVTGGIVGCAVNSTQQEITAADYGPYPENYQEIVKNKLSQELKDPYSAVYEFQEPKRGCGQVTIFSPKKYGWVVNVDVNAKNSFGGYTGYQRFSYLIKDGIIIHEDIFADSR